jgi:hypothetical protein
LWPFIDLAEDAADLGGSFADAWMENGELQWDAQEAWMPTQQRSGGPIQRTGQTDSAAVPKGNPMNRDEALKCIAGALEALAEALKQGKSEALVK